MNVTNNTEHFLKRWQININCSILRAWYDDMLEIEGERCIDVIVVMEGIT